MLSRIIFDTNRWFQVHEGRFHRTPGSTKKWQEIPLTDFPIHILLHTTQQRVGLDGLWKHLRKKRSHSGDHHIFIVYSNGKYWVDDGHHRLVLAKLLGRKSVLARVFIDDTIKL